MALRVSRLVVSVNGRLASFLVAVAVIAPLWLVLWAAPAQATVFSNASSITLNNPTTGNPGCTNPTVVCNAPATPYPSTIAVSGLTGTVNDVTLTLTGATYSFSQDLDLLLVGPTGQTLIPVSSMGPDGAPNQGNPALSNSTVTFSDAGTAPTASTPWGTGNTFKPANFSGFNQTWEAPAPSPPYGNPGPDTTIGPAGASFASQFDGTNPNGTWSLYVITTGPGDGTGAIAGGWSLSITTSSAAGTMTSLSSSPNPSFTSGASSSVTLTATVSSTSTVSEGTVNFTDGGTTISGCGAQAVSAGQATCTTTFTTEGNHSLEAFYSGDSNFGASNGAVTQQVDDHTTVTGSSYCNTGSIALNNPPDTVADASPYPSRVFVSGLTGTLSHLSVTLSGATYSESQDIDALLVGPAGQSFILVADAGPNSGGALSNVTLTLDDAAGTTLASNAAWGAPNASVTSKPFNYGGDNETWGSPAPAGPYGNPGPFSGGTATLGDTFNGTNPDGTWSLYVITTAAGDGTGSIGGGWCADITTANVPGTMTTLASSNNPSFTSAPGNSVTLTATVTSTSTVSEGTVDFTDGGTTISGCGAVPVSGGQATCTTTFSTEGSHSLEALYSGDANFATSNATLSQQVDDHTTVTGSNYCNTGSIALNNPPDTVADASPYPSHVFVSGLPGNLTHLAVSVHNVTYSESQDIDALLVGPTGQSFILVAAAGPNSGGALSNVTLTLDDAAASTLSSSAPWGAANASVTSKPVDYGGDNEIWGPPAPAGPYGNPGPFGGGTATLASTFNGTNPNGTWSLYVITTAAGDGTGTIAGGWCITETIQPAALTIGTQVAATPVTIGTATSDTATLSGIPAGADAPTGTMTFNAYGPSDPTCSNAPAFTSTVSVTGVGTTTPSGAFTPTSTGTYLWTASYSGDSNYSPEASACGDPGETVVVNPASPTIATTASAGTALGGTISDSAVLSGGVSPTGSITFDVYGPDDPTCSNAAAFSSVVTVSGNGTYGSGSFTPTALGTYQFVAVYGGDVNNNTVASACGSPGESVVVSPASPSIATTASAGTALGGTISDSAVLSGGVSPTGSITFDVYGPGDATCSNAPAFTGTATVSGNGTYSSPDFTPTAAGTYLFVASYGGDTNNNAVTSSCGSTGESVVVSPASPSIATTASAGIALGGTISDSAVLSGGVSPTGSITFDVYGPGDATCSNAPAFSSVVTVSGNGTYSSGSFTPTALGTYLFVASYGGDANNNAVAGSCGAAGESVVVTMASPSIATTASAGVALGGTISDSAVLSGGVDTPTGSITFDAYGPADPTCTGTPAFTSTSTVSGNGTYGSADFTTSAAGTYLFVASYSGDANNAAVTGSCGAAGESVVVLKASPSSRITLGGTVTDTATISGGAAPSGTVVFRLYGPGDATCASTPAFTSSAVTVSGDGAYTSPGFTPSAAGTYLWVAAYSGDANNSATTSACGASNESVAVGVTATTTKLVSSVNPSVLGQAVMFTATVTGTNPTGTVTFRDGSTTLGTGTLSTTGTASVATSSLSAGTHSITAVYGGDTSNAGSTSAALPQVVTTTPGLPTITITAPKSGASYRFGQVVRASYTCNDAPYGPGIALCRGTVPSGSPINTRRAGRHTFTVFAISDDGKSAGQSVFYTVRRSSNRFTVSHLRISAGGTTTFDLKLPGPGVVDVLESAWKNNIAVGASLLQPAGGRFVFAREHIKVSRAGSIKVTVKPSAHGLDLIEHPSYPVVIRLWISYTPTGGLQRNKGSYGLPVP